VIPDRRGGNELLRSERPGGIPGGAEAVQGVRCTEGAGLGSVLLQGAPGRGKPVRSILPAGLAIGKELPAYLTPTWCALHGYSPVIIEQAQRFTKSKAEAAELARIDAFLFVSIVGRIPAEPLHLQSARWRSIREAKQEAGHWREELPAVRLRTPDGSPGGLAAVYALTPAYLAEILAAELERGRFAGPARLANRQRVKPSRTAPIMTGIPAELARILATGTGLQVRFLELANILTQPNEYRGLPGSEGLTEAEVWSKALQGWRILAPGLPGAELRPSWMLCPECGWLYTRRPCLQQLPELVRLAGLESLDGQELAEVDFSGAQLNISRGLHGDSPLHDPYRPIMEHLERQGIDIDRDTVKSMVLPMLHGQHAGHYLHALRMGKATEPLATWRALHRAFREYAEVQGLALMQVQGRIMARALELHGETTERAGLPVFDSILTPSPDLVEQAMQEASREALGESIPSTVRRAGQRSFLG